MIKMHIKPCLAGLFFLFLSVSVLSQNKEYVIDTVQIKSEVLKENRIILLFKPLKLVTTDSIRFIYLLDGENSKDWYQKIFDRFKDSVSNVIAVGIVNTDRRRDLLYVNHADKFLDFITKELIPTTEKNYNLKSRILFGHSFGGSFTIYCMIHYPNIFNGYIASSPIPIMALVKKESYHTVDSICNHKTSFQFSVGSKDMAQVITWTNRLNENLKTSKFQNLYWRYEIFADKDHNNSDIVALIHGLEAMLKQGETNQRVLPLEW